MGGLSVGTDLGSSVAGAGGAKSGTVSADPPPKLVSRQLVILPSTVNLGNGSKMQPKVVVHHGVMSRKGMHSTITHVSGNGRSLPTTPAL